MAFGLEAPTEDDLLNLRPIIDITTNAPWVPQEFSMDASPDTVPLERTINTAATDTDTYVEPIHSPTPMTVYPLVTWH